MRFGRLAPVTLGLCMLLSVQAQPALSIRLEESTTPIISVKSAETGVVIEVSEDLRLWSVLKEAPGGEESVSVEDPIGAVKPQRFYRARSVNTQTNDVFESATVLEGTNVTVNTWNISASREDGEPEHSVTAAGDKTLWFKWTSPSSGRGFVNTVGTHFPTTLAVYQGEELTNLTQLTHNYESARLVSFNAEEGEDYLISVGSAVEWSGLITLNVGLEPPAFSGPLTNVTFYGRSSSGEDFVLQVTNGVWELSGPEMESTSGTVDEIIFDATAFRFALSSTNSVKDTDDTSGTISTNTTNDASSTNNAGTDGSIGGENTSSTNNTNDVGSTNNASTDTTTSTNSPTTSTNSPASSEPPESVEPTNTVTQILFTFSPATAYDGKFISTNLLARDGGGTVRRVMIPGEALAPEDFANIELAITRQETTTGEAGQTHYYTFTSDGQFHDSDNWEQTSGTYTYRVIDGETAELILTYVQPNDYGGDKHEITLKFSDGLGGEVTSTYLRNDGTEILVAATFELNAW